LRRRLEHAGSRAVPALLKALSSGDDFARWEAVNLLGILAPSRALEAVAAFALDEGNGMRAGVRSGRSPE